MKDSIDQDGGRVAAQVGVHDSSDVEEVLSRFHIVGVGASAGGLEALETLFDHVPAQCGMAFVVVQHLSPDFKSMMDELLARHTKMAVHRVTDGMQVTPNSVYLIPPKKEMIIQDGQLLLSDKDPSQGLSLPIDTFFRSLAQDAGAHAIGIILSGTGSDGSRGIRDIHDEGGLIIAQSQETAKFDGMPKNAAAAGIRRICGMPKSNSPILVSSEGWKPYWRTSHVASFSFIHLPDFSAVIPIIPKITISSGFISNIYWPVSPHTGISCLWWPARSR